MRVTFGEGYIYTLFLSVYFSGIEYSNPYDFLLDHRLYPIFYTGAIVEGYKTYVGAFLRVTI